jgi:hypothetical protein
MLNKDKQRELAYIVKIDNIVPIEGADKVECAFVNGWSVMVHKGEFKEGDLAVYFEIDSKVPEKEPFLFLAPKKFKIKTQKYFKGRILSQGLLMPFSDFDWTENSHQLGDFVTEELGITYAEEEDNIRKGKIKKVTSWQRLSQKNKEKFSHFPWSVLKKNEIGRKLLLKIFHKDLEKTNAFPAWVKRTDEERIQNIPWILNNKEPWIVTEKIDGTSTTFTIKRSKKGLRRKEVFDFFVCSRNVNFMGDKEKTCFYDTNVYLEMAEQYKVKEALTKILKDNPDLEWVTLQGETFGKDIQRRTYSLPALHKKNPDIPIHMFAGFNLIDSKDGRWNSVLAKQYLAEFTTIPWVPILDNNYYLPDTVDELLQFATGKSVIDGGMREGLVFRSQDGSQSFKAVSNEFLLKYHN